MPDTPKILPDNSWGPTTILIMVIAIIVVLIGGIAVIRNDLTFDQYLNVLKTFAVGVGLTAIGRGIYKAPTK